MMAVAAALASLAAGCSRSNDEQEHEHGAGCSHGAAAQKAPPARAEAEHEHGAACTHGAEAAAADGHAAEAHGAEPPKAGTVFEVPENARRLLGITYATATSRSVRNTVRFPGRFELMPGARRVYSTVAPGVAEVSVRPSQRVRKGEILFRIASPEWSRQTGAKREAEAALALARTEAEAIGERLARLKESGVRNAELEMALKMKEAEAARAESLCQSVESQLRAVRALCREEAGTLVFEARDAGVVERVSADSGAWLDTGAEVVSVAREDGVWFRADASSAETARVRDGQAGFVEPLRGAAEAAERVEGAVSLGWTADAAARVRPVYLTPVRVPAWAAPGLAGVLSVIVEQSAAGSVAVPLACVVPDGLRRVVFVRDEKDPDAFTRTEVALGADDGEWVDVQGLAAGMTVVRDGAYELKLTAPSATSAAPKKAGHFHADGQFYEDSH
jgi:multidrug efflux pump subunit AcrA (membrane-fusion protein)